MKEGKPLSHVCDTAGRIIIEKGMIRIYTDDLEPEETLLILDFVKFVSNRSNEGGDRKIIKFPSKE